MFYRLAGSHLGLLLMTAIILVGFAGMMTDQLRFLIENAHLNFIPEEISLEEDINVLIAAFGVFLEHRGWLLGRIYGEAIPLRLQAYDRYCHDTGVLYIVMAILLECADVLFLAANNWGLDGAGMKYAEIATLFVCNLAIAAAVLDFGRRSLAGDLLAGDPLRAA
ncbi:MAG: hypothetical protein ACPGNT_04025 [Rhodospirillales bacterium]